MASATVRRGDTGPNVESSVSALTWSAVLGGAFAAAAVSLLLAMLGTGIGLSSVSAWTGQSVSGTTFTVGAAIWLIVIQWLSSSMGGYITGRLRTKWADASTDEVFFRDTAHGFLSWAVSTVVVVALVASGAGSAVTGVARTAGSAVSTVVGSATQGAAQGAAQQGAQGGFNPSSYYVDTLFRTGKPGENDQDAKVEAGRILLMGARNGSISDSDKAYLGQLVAARTGMSQEDATKRVNEVMGQIQAAEEKARAAAEQARKVAAQTSFFLFFSMLVGAFVASVAAALGGRQRDEI
ncbi:MAG: hypothetical protein BGO51_07700 [Rhodospirillales bacterium 69-11]|nr:MAG: hypothetical protein BGO51_07700 [Rhodospirillales bacterium 69-11]